MSYTKNTWNTGDTITAAKLNNTETQYDAAAADLAAHKTAAALDHPDNSVTDAKIGNRTPDQTQAPSSPGTGTLSQVLSWLANRIKTITGATNWWDAPAATISTIWGKFNSSTGHKHTGAADDAPILPAASITQGAGSGLNADMVDGVHGTGLAQVISGGAKIQSGTATEASGYTYVNVTFPTAFSAAPLVFFTAPSTNTALYVTNITATGCRLNTDGLSGATLGWLAIGG